MQHQNEPEGNFETFLTEIPQYDKNQLPELVDVTGKKIGNGAVAKQLRTRDKELDRTKFAEEAEREVLIQTPFSLRDHFLQQRAIEEEGKTMKRHFPTMFEVHKYDRILQTKRDLEAAEKKDKNKQSKKEQELIKCQEYIKNDFLKDPYTTTVADVFELDPKDKRRQHPAYQQRIGSAVLHQPMLSGLRVTHKPHKQTNKLEFSEPVQWHDQPEVSIINAVGVETRGLNWNSLKEEGRESLKNDWRKHYEMQFRAMLYHTIASGKKHLFIPPIGLGVFVGSTLRETMKNIITDAFEKVVNELGPLEEDFGIHIYASSSFDTKKLKSLAVTYRSVDFSQLITHPEYKKFAKDIVIVNGADGEQTRVNPATTNNNRPVYYDESKQKVYGLPRYTYLGQCNSTGHDNMQSVGTGNKRKDRGDVVCSTLDEGLASVTTLPSVRIQGNTSAIDYKQLSWYKAKGSTLPKPDPQRIKSGGVVSQYDLELLVMVIAELTTEIAKMEPYKSIPRKDGDILLTTPVTQLILTVCCFASRNDGVNHTESTFEGCLEKAFKNPKKQKDNFPNCITFECFRYISKTFQDKCERCGLMTYNPEVISRELDESTVAKPTTKKEWMESNVVYKNVGFRTKHTLTLLGGFGADEKEAENKERSEKLVKGIQRMVESRMKEALGKIANH